MKLFEEEKINLIREKVINIKKPNILELGVQKGNSTKIQL